VAFENKATFRRQLKCASTSRLVRLMFVLNWLKINMDRESDRPPLASSHLGTGYGISKLTSATEEMHFIILLAVLRGSMPLSAVAIYNSKSFKILLRKPSIDYYRI
jgi:hypothetical protein